MDSVCNQRGLILAAGLGSRLGDLTNNIPKCLVPVNGVPILENCIQSLNKLGINDITILVGYRKEMVNEFVKQKFSNLRLNLVENKEYDSTGTACSLLLGLEKGDYDSEVVIIEGDVFFEPELLRDLVNNSNKINKTSIAAYDPTLSGTFVELDSSKYIRNWVHESKRPENFMVEKAFKTINLTLFHPHSLQLLLSTLKSTLVENGRRSPLEYAFHNFIQVSRLGIQGVEADKKKWFEIDTQEDLAIANNIFQDVVVGG
jgi:NDP-sugar pyrophosphorylase family protein